VRVKQVRVASFIGDLVLEDVESPYEHGFLPYMWFPARLGRGRRHPAGGSSAT
jgi:hypothetical protein